MDCTNRRTRQRVPATVFYFGALWDTWDAFQQDHLSLFASALAFYTLMALFPLLLLVIALGPLFASEQSVLQGVMGMVRDYLPGAQNQVQGFYSKS